MSEIKRRNLLRAGLEVGIAGAGLPSFALRTRAADAETLTLYNGQHRSTTEALIGAFTETTGIKVAVRNAESPELAAQIAEEGARSPADVFFAEQSPPIASLQEKGLLAKTDPTTIQAIPAKF